MTKLDTNLFIPEGVVFRENKVKEITEDQDLFREVLRDIKNIHYIESENKIQLKVERKSNELIIKELPENFSEQ